MFEMLFRRYMMSCISWIYLIDLILYATDTDAFPFPIQIQGICQFSSNLSCLYIYTFSYSLVREDNLVL